MKILVIGATSAIAQGAMRYFADEGASFYITGRNREKFESVKSDLAARGCDVGGEIIDLNRLDEHPAMLSRAEKFLKEFDLVFISHGHLVPQADANNDVKLNEEVIMTNYTSVVSLLTLVSNMMIEKKAGTIAVVVSVAGDRGRQSNYLYGSTKAAIDTYLSGLRNRLHPHGVTVISIKPGFVDTPMTAHMPHNPLFASPEDVGEGIYHAIKKKKDIYYVPWFWRWIMLIIRLIPEPIFKRMRL